MKETIQIHRTVGETGEITITFETINGVYHLASYASWDEFLAQSKDWVGENLFVAAKFAVQCYLGVDPTGANPELLTDVVTEFDPAALTIVRRTVPL